VLNQRIHGQYSNCHAEQCTTLEAKCHEPVGLRAASCGKAEIGHLLSLLLFSAALRFTATGLTRKFVPDEFFVHIE